MKKICIMAIIVAILLSISAVAMAEEESLSLSDANVRAGQTIYLTLKLNTDVTGDTIGVSYTYDRNILEAVVSSCTWSKKGTMSNFNREDAGVWASSTSQNLMGEICVLAFRTKADVEFTDTSVSCTMVIKNDSQEQGTYTTQAKVTYSCDHSYGDWKNGGEIGHIKTCSYCGATKTASHSVGSGVLTKNPEDADHDLLTYSCTICDYVRQVKIPRAEQEENNGPTHVTQEAIEPSRSEDPSDEQTAMPTEKTTMTVPTEPHDHTDKEPAAGAEPTQPYRQDTSKPPKYEDKDTEEVGAGESVTQPATPHEPPQPAQEDSDSKEETQPPKDGASSGKLNDGEDDQKANRDQNDSSIKESEEPAKPQSGANTTATEPTSKGSYPDNSSNVVTQSDREKMETIPAPTFPTAAPTTPYKDYNETPEETKTWNDPDGYVKAPVEHTEPAHDHEHDHTQEQSNTAEGNPALNAVILIVFLTVTIGGAVLYLKKKRK